MLAIISYRGQSKGTSDEAHRLFSLMKVTIPVVTSEVKVKLEATQERDSRAHFPQRISAPVLTNMGSLRLLQRHVHSHENSGCHLSFWSLPVLYLFPCVP